MPRSCLIRGARIARMLRSSRLIALVSATSASAYPAVCASRVRLTARTSTRRWSASARGSSRCAARLELLDPLDFAAVWPDAAGNGERSERQQNRGRDHDALPQVCVGAEDALRNASNQLPAERSEKDEHEKVDGGHPSAHLIRCDALNGGDLLLFRGPGPHLASGYV